MNLQDALDFVFDKYTKCDLSVISSKPGSRRFFFRVVEGHLIDEVLRHRGFRFPHPDMIYAAGKGGVYFDVSIETSIDRYRSSNATQKALFCCEAPDGNIGNLTITQDNNLEILRQHRTVDTFAHGMKYKGRIITEFVKAGNENSVWRPSSLFRIML